MPSKKRGSSVLENAERRIADLKTIDPNLDLGDDLSVSHFTQQIELLRSQLGTYNASLSFADRALNAVEDTEREIRALSERLLHAIAGKYGTDSYEYEMAGGTRKSDRKRPVRKAG